MRFAEIGMLALPFAVFVVWRIVAPAGAPPKALAIGMAALTIAMAVVLVTLWYQDAEPPTAGYVPARQESGHILPPRVEPAPR